MWCLENTKSIHFSSTKHNILNFLENLCYDYKASPRQEQSPIHLKGWILGTIVYKWLFAACVMKWQLEWSVMVSFDFTNFI